METLMVVSSENKNKLIFNNSRLDSVKYISFGELRKRMMFSYDVKALYEVIKTEGLSVSNAKIILDNLYFLSDEVKELKGIYDYLDSKGLIIRNVLAINSIKSSNVVLHGKDFLDSEEEQLLSGVSYSFLDVKKYSYTRQVYRCDTLEDEVRCLTINILELIRSGVSPSKIKIVNLDDDYRMCIEKIFPRYNIPSNIHVDTCLYSLPLIKMLFSSDDLFMGLDKLSEMVKSEEEKEIFEIVLGVFNKYASLPKDEVTYNIIMEELKNTKIKSKVINNAVSEGNIDSIYDEDEYVFVVNFNQGVMPRIYKDEDYLSDKVKSKLGRVTSLEKSMNEKKKVKYFFEHNKNVVISYKKKSENGECYPSSFLEELDVEYFDYVNSFGGSNLDNKIILSRELDKYYKFGEVSESLIKLINSYRDLGYKGYDNRFSGISDKSSINEKIILSSSSLDIINRCSFRYYLSHVLKVERYQNSFMRGVGNLIHLVLSRCNNDGFDLKNEWDNYIKENNIVSDAREKFFLCKLFRETEFIISEIKRQRNYSVLSDECYERKFYINPTNEDNVLFMGIIDKIMYNKDEKLMAVVDFKTGNTKMDLSLVKYGIGVQLPVYLYLLSESEEFKNYSLVGFYLQKIINSEIVREEGKSYLEQKSKKLYLQGYSLGEEDKLVKFDSSYEDSKVIKGLRKSSKGFYHYSKVLSKEEMNDIKTKINNNIKMVISDIKECKFDINPKRVGLENVGCEFCQFKDICFRSERDIVNIDKECEVDAKVD